MLGLCNLKDGTSVTLPARWQDPIGFDYQNARVAYVGVQSTGTALLLAGPAGVIAKQPAYEHQEFAYITISPKGDEVLTVSKFNAPYVLSLAQRALWDIPNNTVSYFGAEPFIQTQLTFMQSTGTPEKYPVIQFTPDGKGLAWTSLKFTSQENPITTTRLEYLE